MRQNIRLDWFRVTKDTRDAKPAIESTALECVAKAFHEEIRRTFLLSPIWKLHSFRACLCPQSQCVEIWVSRDWSINCLWCFDLIIMNTISSKRSTRPRCHFTNSRRNDLAKRSCSSTYSTLDVGVYCLPSAIYTPWIRFEDLLLSISPPTCARHVLWFPNVTSIVCKYIRARPSIGIRCFSATRFTATATENVCLRPKCIWNNNNRNCLRDK